MDSGDLFEVGFELVQVALIGGVSWDAAVGGLPDQPGAYAFLMDDPFGRLFGESDILYIGSAASLRRRFKLYLDTSSPWYEGTSSRVMKWAENAIDIGWTQTPTLKDARALERQVLLRYESDHGELPPLNRRGG